VTTNQRNNYVLPIESIVKQSASICALRATASVAATADGTAPHSVYKLVATANIVIRQNRLSLYHMETRLTMTAWTVQEVTTTIMTPDDVVRASATETAADNTSSSTDIEFDVDAYLEQHLGYRRSSAVESVSLTVVYVLILLTGVVGNVVTCIVIVRNSYMHNATNCYLFSLAISDTFQLVLGKHRISRKFFRLPVKKVKCAILLLEFRRGAHLPS